MYRPEDRLTENGTLLNNCNINFNTGVVFGNNILYVSYTSDRHPVYLQLYTKCKVNFSGIKKHRASK